jgi:hypothetical protein
MLSRELGVEMGDRIRLTLDLGKGTLSVHKNGARLGCVHLLDLVFKVSLGAESWSMSDQIHFN